MTARFARVSLHSLLVLLACLSAPSGRAGQAGPYATAGNCGGFPRVALRTPPGTCVGLVAAHLGFARGVAMIGRDIYVADMGGWRQGRGRILRLGEDGRAAPQTILAGLDMPNALVPGPQRTLYVGMLGKVVAFDPDAADPRASVREILVGLPEQGRHPLPALAVAADGALFVNLGSASDNCRDDSGAAPDANKPCPETQAVPPRGVLLRVVPGTAPVDAAHAEIYARGLRNSMALAVLPSGALLAASNARDAINQADPALADAELPHEPLVRVARGADYGWPYCYDERRPSPEYPQHDCSGTPAPDLLLPAHAAPLGMLLYRGQALPGLDGRLLIACHGYRANGHRLVALGLDAQGQPSAAAQDVISGWDGGSAGHPRGAPVALFEAPDGSVLLTEDHNGTLLRLAAAP
jgi:glucose/arabinose dehydrogenase